MAALSTVSEEMGIYRVERCGHQMEVTLTADYQGRPGEWFTAVCDECLADGDENAFYVKFSFVARVIKPPQTLH